MKLGTSTALFARRRGSQEHLSYIDETRLCAKAGFKVIDVDFSTSTDAKCVSDLAADDWEARIELLGSEGAKLGVEFTQAHAPYDQNLFTFGKQPGEEYVAMFREMTRRTIIAAGRLGIKWVVVHPFNDTVNTEYDNEIQKKTNIDFYMPFLELAVSCGTGLAVENMADFSRENARRYYCVNADDLIDLVDTVNDPAFGVCWDFGHARMVMSDQPRQLKRIGKRLKATHVQDNYGKHDSHLIPFVGGDIKWEQIMPVLKEIGYEGDFVLEAHSYMNEIPDALRMSAARLAYDFGMHCIKMYEQA